MDSDKKVDFEVFKQKFLESLKKYDEIDHEKSTVQSLDIGSATYQIVIIVWAHSAYDEPIKTIIVQSALRIQKSLIPPATT